MKQIAAGIIVFALVSQAAPVWAQDSTLEQAGYGVGGVVGTILYAPLKTIFCVGGGIASAFTAIGSPPTARRMVSASCGGSWVITPSNVRGDDPVQFVGGARASARTVDMAAVAAR